MYSVGEIRRGRELGFVRKRQAFIYHPCIDCGKLRWVRRVHKKPQVLRCGSCAGKALNLAGRLVDAATSRKHIEVGDWVDN